MQTIKINTDNSAQVHLLEPMSSKKLHETINKTGMKSNSPQHIHQRNILEAHLNSRKAPTRFLIHTRDDIKVILYDEVVCCVADSNYTRIYLNDGSKVMVSKTLKDFETILNQQHFFRIHASYLINLHYIKRIVKAHQYLVELPKSFMLKVSRSRREGLMHKMETL